MFFKGERKSSFILSQKHKSKSDSTMREYVLLSFPKLPFDPSFDFAFSTFP